ERAQVARQNIPRFAPIARMTRDVSLSRKETDENVADLRIILGAQNPQPTPLRGPSNRVKHRRIHDECRIAKHRVWSRCLKISIQATMDVCVPPHLTRFSAASCVRFG